MDEASAHMATLITKWAPKEKNGRKITYGHRMGLAYLILSRDEKYIVDIPLDLFSYGMNDSTLKGFTFLCESIKI
jgi:hypothetical protein